MAVKIDGVLPGSPAQRAGLRAGDLLERINGQPVSDGLEYRFYCADTRLLLELTRDGAPYRAAVVKEEDDDLGLTFASYLIDRQHTCKNKCIFCFVDQMPKGLRPSLYVKDDDDRMSFLFGNYITLTNLTDRDIERILRVRISPINVSVHTTDPQLRVTMMKNPRAADSLAYLRRLVEGGIRLNTQLVLCPGVNDGPALERTLRDLSALWPGVQSVALVPVGLTRHREGLAPLRPYTAREAQAVLGVAERFSQAFMRETGERFAYPADEFFLTAGRPIPGGAYYGEYRQLENGVGLIALLREEFYSALRLEEGEPTRQVVTLATGVAAAPFMRELCAAAMERFPGLQARVEPIVNDFFGHTITVAGLVTGRDLVAQLRARGVQGRLLLPAVMLRHERDKFLDDLTLPELEQALGVRAQLVENDGFALLDALLGREAPA